MLLIDSSPNPDILLQNTGILDIVLKIHSVSAPYWLKPAIGDHSL